MPATKLQNARPASSGAFVPTLIPTTRTYEELDGAQGREVFFRPQRYRAADLAPLDIYVVLNLGAQDMACAIIDVSQSGIAFQWDVPSPVALDQVFDDFAVRAAEFEAYRGQARVSSVRHSGNSTIVAVSFVDFLLNMDDLLTLRDIRRWRRDEAAGLPASTRGWFTAGNVDFKAKVADLRPALQRAIASGKPACINVMIQRLAAPTVTAGTAGAAH